MGARLDAELVRRKLASSRAQARELIAAGQVTLCGRRADKASRQVEEADAIEIAQMGEKWASRGAYKLLGALDYLGERAPQIAGVRALDAGASTGGFTDVLLARGAASVVAVDVGTGQLVSKLKRDPRVEIRDGTNVRSLRPEDVAPAPRLVVGDLSFISLPLVLPALRAAAHPAADFLLLVKPQFEVGREKLPRGGVVRDLALHEEAVRGVALAAGRLGLDTWEVAASPLPGPAGNVEYFLALRAGHRQARSAGELDALIRRAIHNGPGGPYELKEGRS